MAQNTSGFYLGLGSGTSTVVAHDSQYFDDNSDYYPISIPATVNHLFPAVQIGYWSNAGYNALWGVKAFYKYLDANLYYNITDTFSGTIKVPHEVALLLTFGVTINKITPYLGVGAMWLPRVEDIYREDTAAGEQRIGKSRIGAIIQLGFLYNLTANWFVDTVYSYGFTGRSTYSGYSDTLDSGTFVSRKNRVTTQEVMVSINRRF